MADQLTGTSNAGAVTHATGVKVFAESFGLNRANAIDLDPSPTVSRYEDAPLTSLSGKVNQTIMEETVAAGKATALINSGAIAEPGTGAFVAKVGYADVPTGLTGFDVFPRAQFALITEQVVRSGVDVILGGGERWMLPQGEAGVFGGALNVTGARTDGRNLIQEAQALGYRVIYTQEDLATVRSGEKILGVFAWEDTYNSSNEEILAAQGRNPYGQPGNPNPVAVADMLKATLAAVSNDPDGFFVVLEEEGTDNLPNNNNAIGAIEAALRADAAIGVAQEFIRNVNPNTLLLTAADSEAGGLQVWQPTPFAPGFPSTLLTTQPTVGVNPTNVATQNVIAD